MWLENIENIEVIKGVYKDQLPNLDEIIVNSLNISTGENLDLIIVFDIENLPNNIPSKWKEGKVNTIQIILNFISAEIKCIGLNNKNYRNLCLDIVKLENGTKRIMGIDKTGKSAFEFNANWIYVKNISGYYNENI